MSIKHQSRVPSNAKRLYSAISALPQSGLVAAFVFGASSLVAQTTISSGHHSFSTETTLDLGELTRDVGGTALFSGSGVISASGTLTNGVLPWGIFQNSGAAANNSSAGFTFATISGGSIVPYTGATAVTTSYPANSATTNYDWSAAGTQAQIGTSRAANTIRYTGTGVTQTTNSAQTQTFNALMNAGTGTVTLGGGNTMNIRSATGDLVLAAMTANIVINGPIINNGVTPGAVTILGGSGQSVTLAGASTYTGGTNINSGKLIATAGGLNGGAVRIAAGATLTFTGNVTSTSAVSGAGSILNDTANTIVITGDHSGFSGDFTHSAGSNNTQFNSATSGSANAAYTITAGELIFAANGNYTVQMGSLSSSGGNIRGGNAATGTTTLEIGNLGTDTSIAGNINNGGTKVMAVTKVGGGSLTINGNNNFSGGTIVSDGTLFVNGALTSTANTVFVDENGTLGGSGTIAGAVTVNGTLAAGNSPGVLTISNNLTLGGTSTSIFEVAGLTRGTEYDGVDVGGALTYGGTLSISFTSTIQAGTYSFFDGFTSQSGAFDNVSFSFDDAESVGGSLVLDINGWTASSAVRTYAFDYASGDMIVSAIPEPSSAAALAGMLMLGFAGLRRRRSIKA